MGTFGISSKSLWDVPESSMGSLTFKNLRFIGSKFLNTVAKRIATFGFSHKVPMLKVVRAVSFFGRKE